MPSSLAPMRRMAWRERSFSESVFNSTRMQPRVSNAWRSSRDFASVLIAVRRHGPLGGQRLLDICPHLLRSAYPGARPAPELLVQTDLAQLGVMVGGEGLQPHVPAFEHHGVADHSGRNESGQR